MPNYCSFVIRAEGKTENIEKLYKWLNADYTYDREEGIEFCSEEHHFYRVFECICDESFDDKDEWDSKEFSGYCAWSVSSCMIDSEENYSYYSGQKYEIDLLEASKILDLTIKVASDELGCSFAEHYIIRNGEFLVNDVREIIPEYNSNDEIDDFDLYDEIVDKLYEEFFEIDSNY